MWSRAPSTVSKGLSFLSVGVRSTLLMHGTATDLAGGPFELSTLSGEGGRLKGLVCHTLYIRLDVDFFVGLASFFLFLFRSWGIVILEFDLFPFYLSAYSKTPRAIVQPEMRR
jgi:hypothetical protein